MLGNFRNKDTLQIFNERWKTNYNAKKSINNLRKNSIMNNTPSAQAKRVTKPINNINQRNNFINKLK